MTIGVSREEFYHSTLVELRDYDEVYDNRRRIEDEKALLDGMYIFEAVSTALANAFRKKGTKPIPYRTKGFLEVIRENEHSNRPLTEEEKNEQINNLFAMLGSMQKSFEASHKGGGA